MTRFKKIIETITLQKAGYEMYAGGSGVVIISLVTQKPSPIPERTEPHFTHYRLNNEEASQIIVDYIEMQDELQKYKSVRDLAYALVCARNADSLSQTEDAIQAIETEFRNA